MTIPDSKQSVRFISVFKLRSYPASWRSFKLKKSYKRKKDMILTKLTFIFMQKGTTFINTCCFSFDLEPTLLRSLGD